MLNKKNEHIQMLRGLAIIAVVLIHNTPSGLAQVFCRPFINFSVGLFLFLSGMLSDAEKWRPWKRIKKVIIPYILWTFIYVLMGNIESPLSIPLVFVKNLLTGRSAAVMYYIFVYCQFTLLIPFIDKLGRSKFKYFGFLISPMEIIIMRLIPLVASIEFNAYIEIGMSISCLGWFTYFYIGYLLGNKIITIKISTSKLIYLLIISIIIQIAEGYWYFMMGESNCGTQLKISSIITSLVFVIISYRCIDSEKIRTCSVLKMIGDNSFGIYISHISIMMVMYKIPCFSKIFVFPFNAIAVIGIDLVCIVIGKKVLGKYSKYFAL